MCGSSCSADLKNLIMTLVYVVAKRCFTGAKKTPTPLCNVAETLIILNSILVYQNIP